MVHILRAMHFYEKDDKEITQRATLYFLFLESVIR